MQITKVSNFNPVSKASFKGLSPKARYIASNLIVGARQGLSGLRKLKKEEGVNLVIDVHDGAYGFFEKIWCNLLGIKRKVLPMNLVNPNFELKKAGEEALALIKENEGGKTFVHCRSGKHRSVLICAAHEVKNGRIKSPQEFDEFVKSQNFYQFRHKRVCLIPVQLTPQELQARIDRINLHKRNFLTALFGDKK